MSDEHLHPYPEQPRKEKKSKTVESKYELSLRLFGALAALFSGTYTGYKSLAPLFTSEQSSSHQQQDFIEYSRDQIPEIVEAIQLVENTGGYDALEPTLFGLRYNFYLLQLVENDYSNPDSLRLAYNGHPERTSQYPFQIEAQYLVNLSPEAAAQFALLDEAMVIINQYRYGTSLVSMLPADRERLNEILFEDFSLLKNELQARYVANQTLLLDNYRQVLAAHPELLTVINQVNSVQTSFEMLGSVEDIQNPVLVDNYTWLSRMVETLGYLKSPEPDASYADLERWITDQWTDSIYYATTYFRSNGESYSLWQQDIDNLNSLDQNLTQFQKQLDQDATKSGIASFALFATAIALVTAVQFQKLSWSRRHWNRHERRKFDAISTSLLNKEIGIIKDLLKKPTLDSDHKTKLTSHLNLLLDTKTFLAAVAEQWDSANRPTAKTSASSEIDLASEPVTINYLGDDPEEAETSPLENFRALLEQTRPQ